MRQRDIGRAKPRSAGSARWRSSKTGSRRPGSLVGKRRGSVKSTAEEGLLDAVAHGRNLAAIRSRWTNRLSALAPIHVDRALNGQEISYGDQVEA